MTMTNNDRLVSEARALRRELIDDKLLDQLLASTSERGIALTGQVQHAKEALIYRL